MKTCSLEVQISLPRLFLGQLDVPHVSLGHTQIEIKADKSPTKKAAAPERKTAPKPLHCHSNQYYMIFGLQNWKSFMKVAPCYFRIAMYVN